MNSHKKKVLVIDDSPVNTRFLANILSANYQVASANNGASGLSCAVQESPDLILLDIMMPDMNGYEVLIKLREMKGPDNIPVIFVTSKGQDIDEAHGLALGAVDYITKPIASEVLLARVQTHIELFAARKELEAKNLALQEANRLREDMERMTAHDLKTPLNFIIGGPQALLAKGDLPGYQREVLSRVVNCGYRMLNMINSSLDMFKMERGSYHVDLIALDILGVTRNIVSESETFAASRNLSIKILLNGVNAGENDVCIVLGEELLCFSMMSNLLKNALEAAPEGDTITVSFRKDSKMSITIENGGVVPKHIQERFFDKFVTVGKKEGTGLGTYIARLIATTLNGSIHLDTSLPGRTSVQVELPAVTPSGARV